MKTKASRQQLEDMAAEIFELGSLSTLARTRARTGGDAMQLTETEFLALDSLVKQGPLSVGQIQKKVGVLPAQMSRIIRSLETKGDKPFVECSINPQDRRKIDVVLTDAGWASYEAYKTARLALTMQILADLGPEDRDEFIRILRTIRMHIANRLKIKQLQNSP